MKFEEWLAVLGFFAVVAVMVVAILPESLWQTQRPKTGPVNGATQAAFSPGVPGVAGRGRMPLVPQGVAVAAVRPQPTAPTQQRTTRAQPGLMPFEQAARVRFQGSVQQISELQQQDGQIHVWLNNALGREQHLSVAPAWFLHYMGCSLTHDAVISGVGFQFDKKKDGAVTYVKKLVIGKKVCHLRNDEGFALWSNQLR